MTDLHVRNVPRYLQESLRRHAPDAPVPTSDDTPVEYADVLGHAYLACSKYDHRKNGGHYFTPTVIGRFMAERHSYSEPHLRVLDPGSGAGVLSAAVCEAASKSSIVKSLHVDAYEAEPLLADLTHLTLAFSREWLALRGVALTFDVVCGDFVLDHAATLKAIFNPNRHELGFDNLRHSYDLVISNPPYFKIGKDDPRAIAWSSVVRGQPNIYTLFMAVSADLLSKSGKLVYIVPRSFASGPYFRKFREVFFRSVVPTAIHLFESRKDVFRNQTVLQENLIFIGRKRIDGEAFNESQVLVSHSKATEDLANRKRLLVGLDSVLDLGTKNKELCIPLSSEDLALVQAVRKWPETLWSLGLDISTGPVVPFRATQFLAHAASGPSTAPLLWMHNVRPMRVEWPSAVTHKPQWIEAVQTSTKLLVRDKTYVLLRRFSAKEEKRRLVAAPLVRGCLNARMVGLENHLNYIRGVSRCLDEELALGLAALLNSVFLDRYFRVSNGNTQVSATELRAMPLPNERVIRSIGVKARECLRSKTDLPMIDALVAEILSLSPDYGLTPVAI